jgi:hypothetical protein
MNVSLEPMGAFLRNACCLWPSYPYVLRGKRETEGDGRLYLISVDDDLQRERRLLARRCGYELFDLCKTSLLQKAAALSLVCKACEACEACEAC